MTSLKRKKIVVKKIAAKLLPAEEHFSFLTELQTLTLAAIELVNEKLVAALVKELSKESLAKSEPEEPSFAVKRIRKSPSMSLDILKILSPVIDQHLSSIKYILLGKLADPSSLEALKTLGIKTRVPAGAIIQALLSSLDANQKFYSIIHNTPAPVVNSTQAQRTLDFIKERVGRHIDEKILAQRNALLQTLENSIQNHNFSNVKEMQATVNAIEETKGQIKAIADKKALVRRVLTEGKEKKLSIASLTQELKSATRDYGTDWDLVVRTETGIASSMAQVQRIYETFGQKDAEIKVIILVKDDPLVSKYCHEWSKNPDGSYKYFNLSDLKPPGYNLGKKKKDWLNSVPLRHFRCRCLLHVVPRGFRVDHEGSIIVLKEGEVLKTEP